MLIIIGSLKAKCSSQSKNNIFVLNVIFGKWYYLIGFLFYKNENKATKKRVLIETNIFSLTLNSNPKSLCCGIFPANTVTIISSHSTYTTTIITILSSSKPYIVHLAITPVLVLGNSVNISRSFYASSVSCLKNHSCPPPSSDIKGMEWTVKLTIS